MNAQELGASVVLPTPVHLGGTPRRKRSGRGYSIGEVKQAGLNIHEIRPLGARVDERRKSIHSENVTNLKDWFASIESLKAKLKRKEEKAGDTAIGETVEEPETVKKRRRRTKGRPKEGEEKPPKKATRAST